LKPYHFTLFLCFYFITQLLAKEQELAERVDALREASSQMESLKLEITRLRPYEEELADLQVAKNNIIFYVLSFFFALIRLHIIINKQHFALLLEFHHTF
jgi:hypothetical protein